MQSFSFCSSLEAYPPPLSWQKGNSYSSALSTAPYRCIEVWMYPSTSPAASDGHRLTAVTSRWPNLTSYGNSNFQMSVIYRRKHLKTISNFATAKLQFYISETIRSLTAYSWLCVLHTVLFRKKCFKPLWKAVSIRQWKEMHNCIHRNSKGLGSLCGLSTNFKVLVTCSFLPKSRCPLE